MATYVPKNRIITNLFTNGDEYLRVDTNQPYTGFYHKLYTGELYTGKNNNDKPVVRLKPLPKPTPKVDVNKIAFIDDESTKIYNSVKEVDVTKILSRPTNIVIKPTEDDYKVGEYTRYILKKVNEPTFVETDKKTFDKISQKDDSYNWYDYLTIKLPWLLTGDELEVAKTNRNQIYIIQSKYKFRGLDQFLGENYLQYYLES